MLAQIIFLKQLEAKLEILEARQLEQWHSIKVMRDELAKEMTRITSSIELMREEEVHEENEIAASTQTEDAEVQQQFSDGNDSSSTNETMEELLPASIEVIPINESITQENKIAEEKVVAELILPKEESKTSDVTEVHTTPLEEPVLAVKEIPTPVNNTTTPTQNSINDQYNNKPNNIAEQLTLKPINDLKSAIGTNDRFLFIAQLFGGDANKFNQAIVNLNHCANLDAAIQHLHNNYKRSEWEQNHKTLEQLEIYLRRRYANS